MQITIGEIAEEAMVVTPSTKCEYIYSVFDKKPSLEGIVVCDANIPTGLVMKTHLYQKLSTKYGFHLFMNRTIDLIMNPTPLIVDYSTPITEVSALAMQRAQEYLYDYVVVTLEEQMFGIVSIKNLLIKLAEIQVDIARYSNPLTGLPGNHAISETLAETLSTQAYSVLYIDINSFKVFNDTFGFKQGDEMIQETAAIISDCVKGNDQKPPFVGHIGGDDFIAVIYHHNHEEICKRIICQFEEKAQRFYTPTERQQGFVVAISRRGILEEVPMIGLSIAVVQNKHYSFQTTEELSKHAAYLKKMCKAQKTNTYLTLEDCEVLVP